MVPAIAAHAHCAGCVLLQLLAGFQAQSNGDSRAKAAPPPVLDAVASAAAEAKPPLPPTNAVASASAEAKPPLLKASASALAPACSSGQQLHGERKHKR